MSGCFQWTHLNGWVGNCKEISNCIKMISQITKQRKEYWGLLDIDVLSPLPPPQKKKCKRKMLRGGSRTAATSKMKRFVIIVNGFHIGCCSSPRSAFDTSFTQSSYKTVFSSRGLNDTTEFELSRHLAEVYLYWTTSQVLKSWHFFFSFPKIPNENFQ